MDVEQEKAKFNEFLQKPGYKMQFRHALYTAQKLRKLNEEERKAELIRFSNESHFLLRRTVDPGFYRFVKKKEMRRKKWFWNQIREVGYLILLDILHPENATPTRAARKPSKIPNGTKDFSAEWVTERHLRRIRTNYPEVFFTPSKGTVKIVRDKRVRRYTTIFSDMSEADKSDWNVACEILMWQDLARIPNTEKVDEMRMLHASLRMVEPDDILGLQRFWECQKTSLRIITFKFGHASRESWLIRHIEKGTSILEHIYQLIDDAVALRWYRTIKSEEKRMRLLEEKHPLRYTREDATIAVKRNSEWFKDPARVADYIFRGADAYIHIGKYKVALYLFKECLKQIPLEEEDMGLCHHNIAWTYRMMRKPRKYLIWLRKALSIFEELNNPFHVGITWAYIAEAHYLQNNAKQYQDAVQRSKNILSNSDLSSFQRAEAFLCMADCAMRTKNRAWEREAVVMGLKSTSEFEDSTFALYFNQRLTDLDAGKNTFEAEKEPGKLKRPPLFRWHKEGSERFLPLSPNSTSEA